MMLPVSCYAAGRPGDWEAICIDFDIAVQGRSFEEVQNLLDEAVNSYVDEVFKEEDPAVRAALLQRRAPLGTRLSWVAGLAWATLCGRHYRNGDEAATSAVPFAVVPCHA